MKSTFHADSSSPSRLWGLTLLFWLGSQILYGQEQLGLRLDNFSGINASVLNPAATAVQPFQWDINLIEASLFVDNNYAFIEETYLFDLTRRLRDDAEVVLQDDFDQPEDIPPNALVIDFFDTARRRNVFVSAATMGPSFSVNFKNHSLGLVTRARVMTSTQDVPITLAYDRYEARSFGDDFAIQPFRIVGVSWSELGLNYAHRRDTYDGRISFGLTAKFLLPQDVGYAQIETPFRLTKFPGDTLSASRLNLEVGYTTTTLTTNDVRFQPQGSGFGMDVGFQYLISEYEDSYRWKLGLAVLDLGYLNFDRDATLVYRFDADSLITVDTDAFSVIGGRNGLMDAAEILSRFVYNDPAAAASDSPIRVWLPAALSLQAEYAYADGMFFNMTLVQRLRFGTVMLDRSNLLAFTPRYEHRWFAIQVPLAVYNWQDFRAGIAVRLAYLTIGTDHLSSLVFRERFSGTDVYVALRVNPFRLSFGKSRSGGRGKVRCPDVGR